MPFYIGQTDYIAQLNAMETNASRTTYDTTSFALYDATDNTKTVKFNNSAWATGTTFTFTFPGISTTLAGLANVAQTFAGNTTFSNATVSVGTSTAASTYGLGTGATVNAATKTINIGTNGVAGSTTTINIGPTLGNFNMTIQGFPYVVGGIKIGTAGVSSDVNTLDYYQEGTFTPVVAGITTAGTGTYTTQAGRYTRIGNRVYFNLQVVQTAHTGTGGMIITGLPFTSDATMDIPLDLRCSDLTYTGQLSATVPANSSRINLETLATGAAPTALAMDGSCTLWVSGQYMVP